MPGAWSRCGAPSTRSRQTPVAADQSHEEKARRSSVPSTWCPGRGTKTPIRTIPASDLRKALHGAISSPDELLLITTRGPAKAVLIDTERHNQMIDDLQDLEDARNPEMRQGAQEARREDLMPLEEALKRYGL